MYFPSIPGPDYRSMPPVDSYYREIMVKYFAQNNYFFGENEPRDIVSRMDLFQGLNQRQKDAVISSEGPLLILAGAGAGKTKTITHRILYLIAEKGVLPEEIMAITFTNKAAREMRDRVEGLLRSHNITKSSGKMPFVSTFHSLGVAIIKENAALLNLR